MMVWRSRRYLADAASVRLTRNPDALARALERLSVHGDLLSKARWAEPLFVVGSSRGAWSEELGGVVGSHPRAQAARTNRRHGRGRPHRENQIPRGAGGAHAEDSPHLAPRIHARLRVLRDWRRLDGPCCVPRDRPDTPRAEAGARASVTKSPRESKR